MGLYVVNSMKLKQTREADAPPAAALSVIDGGQGEPAAQPDDPRPHRRTA
jgi:hypothetical protein